MIVNLQRQPPEIETSTATAGAPDSADPSEPPVHIMGAVEATLCFPLRPVHHRAALMFGDVILIAMGAYAAWSAGAVPFLASVSLVVASAIVAVMWLVMADAADAYDVHVATLPRETISRLNRVTVAVATIVAVGGLVRVDQVAWGRLALVVVSFHTAVVVWRWLYARVASRPLFRRRVVILGTGPAGEAIAEAIAPHKQVYELVGFVGDQPAAGTSEHRILASKHLHKVVREEHVTDLVVAIPDHVPAELVRPVVRCAEAGVRVIPMPEMYEAVTDRLPVEHVGAQWFTYLPVNRRVGGWYAPFKRLVDIAVSLVGLLVLGLIFPFVALAMRLDSSGPLFYRPERMGRGGRRFRLWKFRSMVPNADQVGDPTFTAVGDSRITRVGNFLRQSHIDELPQFVNILRGEMSLIGPRPERFVPEFFTDLPFYSTRQVVRPGAAGWALVRQGYAEGAEETLKKLEYDLYYVKHRSFWLDLSIAVRTVLHMVSGEGR